MDQLISLKFICTTDNQTYFDVQNFQILLYLDPAVDLRYLELNLII